MSINLRSDTKLLLTDHSPDAAYNQTSCRGSLQEEVMEGQLTSKEIVAHDGSLLVTCESRVEGRVSDSLWQISQSGFVELNQASLLKQDMTENEFRADMTDESVIKYILYESEDGQYQPIGYCPIHTEVGDLLWMNQFGLHRTFEGTIAEDRFLYIGSLVIAPQARGLRKASFLVSNFARQMADDIRAQHDYILAGIDFASFNDPRLPRLLQFCFEAEKLGLEIVEASKQRWDLITLAQPLNDLSASTPAKQLSYEQQMTNNLLGLGENIIDTSELTEEAKIDADGLPMVIHSDLLNSGLFSMDFAGLGERHNLAYLQGLHSLYARDERPDYRMVARNIAAKFNSGIELIVDYDETHQDSIKLLIKHLRELFGKVEKDSLDYQTYSLLKG